MNETAIVLSEGTLNWSRYERIGDRYGAIHIETGNEIYANFADAPLGTVGTLIAEVVEARKSGHIGDMFHGFSPETPDVGERIVLGTGTLFAEELDDYDITAIGVRPLTETRDWNGASGGPDTFWMDPRALYRAHEQTVRLVFEPGEVRF